MPLSEFEAAKIEQELADLVEAIRPSVDIRDELDVVFRLEGQSVLLFEKRPLWDDPSKFSEAPFAKATFVKGTGQWSVYWMRGSGKWQRYDPCDTVGSLDEWVRLVDEDAHHCFKG